METFCSTAFYAYKRGMQLSVTRLIGIDCTAITIAKTIAEDFPCFDLYTLKERNVHKIIENKIKIIIFIRF